LRTNPSESMIDITNLTKFSSNTRILQELNFLIEPQKTAKNQTTPKEKT